MTEPKETWPFDQATLAAVLGENRRLRAANLRLEAQLLQQSDTVSRTLDELERLVPGLPPPEALMPAAPCDHA